MPADPSTGARVDITELRRLHEEATPGPWRTHDTWLDVGGYTEVVIRSDRARPWSVAWLPTRSADPAGDNYRCREDAALIAALRNALPSLLDELAASRQATHEVTGAARALLDALCPGFWKAYPERGTSVGDAMYALRAALGANVG